MTPFALPPRRRLAALAGLAVLLAGPAAAQPTTTITFDEPGPMPGMVWQPNMSEFVTQDFRIGCTNSNTGTVCNTLTVIGAASPAAPGSGALLNNNLFGITTITRVDGGAFDLVSIAASPFAPGFAGNLVFQGMLATGATVSQTFALTGPVGAPTTFTFSEQFRGVVWVRFGGDANPPVVPVVDQIVLRDAAGIGMPGGPGVPSVVPEPATVVLLGSGLVALGGMGVARRRRG